LSASFSIDRRRQAEGFLAISRRLRSDIPGIQAEAAPVLPSPEQSLSSK
jgi:hypothetical protein